MSRMKILLIFAIIYAIVVFMVYVFRRKKNPNKSQKQYDERQLLIQGKAYKYSFFTLLIYFIGIGIVSIILEKDFASTYVYGCIGLCLSLSVYVTYSLFNDAYIGMDASSNLSVAGAFMIGVCTVGPSLFYLDKIMVDGVLQNTTAPLVVGLTCIYIGIILLVKKQKDARGM